MSFIRTQVENRNIFMMLLIAFLCISCVSIATLIYAAGPLLIAGIPAAKFIWGVVAAATTAYTAWQMVESLIADLDDEIADLEQDIIRLTKRKNNHWSDYQHYRAKMMSKKSDC